MSEGILLVFSDPGPAVSDAEFNDWYDNEHIPIRVPIPSFLSWSRWVATDGQTPAYAALYDLTDPDAVNQPPYSTLVDTRSEREKDIFARAALIGRRIYTSLPAAVPPKAGAAYDPAKPGTYLTLLSANVPPELEAEFNKWYDEEHIALLARVPGWVRSRRYVLKEKLELGSGGSESEGGLRGGVTGTVTATGTGSEGGNGEAAARTV